MEKSEERLVYIDHIRWVMIILVVLMHLNVTYSGGGLWYYKEPAELDMMSGLIFGLYGSLTQAYFMGLLFFVAGYFAAKSIDKKGSNKFIINRLVRLGVPTLIYMVVIHPGIMLMLSAFDHSMPANLLAWYGNFLFSFSFLSTSGPLWFTYALLIFSMFYAEIYQKKAKMGNKVTPQKSLTVTHGKVLALIGLIAVFAFITRIFMPAGVPLGNTLTGNFMQVGYFPSYIVLFIVGIQAFRLQILKNIPKKIGMFWFKMAFLIGLPVWFSIMIFGAAKSGPAVLFGGFTWQSAAYAAWEAFFCIGISIGILTIFRENFNTKNKLTSLLSDNAFGVYVFHAPVLVAVTLALQGLAVHPVAKMYGVALIVLPASFIASYLLRKIPVIKKVFS